MKILQILLRIKAVILPAFAGWVGMAIYSYYHQGLSRASYMLWHDVLVVIFFVLATLVYMKFFDHFSLTVILVVFLATVLVSDIVAFALWPEYLVEFSSLDFITAYALMVATVSLTHTIYHKPWRKKSS